MIICLIAEGSYPYITGGVSSWIHQLMNALPEFQFKVLSIMPSHEKVMKVHYKAPANLIEVKTIYLDDFTKRRQKSQKILTKRIATLDKQVLDQFVRLDDELDFSLIVRAIKSKKNYQHTIDFLTSAIFWDSAVKVYNEEHITETFNQFFWTYRSMFVTLFSMFEVETMGADVYHSVSTGYAGFLCSLLSIMTGKPNLLTEHGIYPREREEEILKATWVPSQYKKMWIRYFYFLSRLSYRYADLIVTLFQRNMEIQHEIGADKEKTNVVANAVDVDALPFVERKEKKDGFVIGAVLRVTPIKDVMTLIRAFRIVKAKMRQVKLEIIGPTDEDEDYYRQCLQLIHLLQLEDDIVFTGRVNVKEYYERMDVLVLTSISEGQPLVILEAMSVGIPIVATDVGSCRDMLLPKTDELCGIITKLVHPQETAEAVVTILSDYELAKKMGMNGRKRAEQSYRKEDFINQYRQFYLALNK